MHSLKPVALPSARILNFPPTYNSPNKHKKIRIGRAGKRKWEELSFVLILPKLSRVSEYLSVDDETFGTKFGMVKKNVMNSLKKTDVLEHPEDTESILLSLKEQALEATKNADAIFYENYLDDRAVAIVPAGIFDKKAIVTQMGSANSPFKSVGINDTKAIVLTPDSGIVTYKATYKREDKTEFEVFVTTVYARTNGRWKGFFYQQTPILRTG